MKQQIVIIHGGDSFNNYKEYLSFLRNFKIDFKQCRGKRGWKEALQKVLGKNFEVILPQMPNKTNAKYSEWKIWFNKFLPYLRQNVILIGHSLGGIFLAKYLAENKFPKKIKAIFLIAAPYDEKNADYSLADFKLPKNLTKFKNQYGKIFLYHSKDDKIVPFINFGKYRNLLPDATGRIFNNRGHFNQEKLPELARDIKQLKNKNPAD